MLFIQVDLFSLTGKKRVKFVLFNKRNFYKKEKTEFHEYTDDIGILVCKYMLSI